MIMMRSFRVNIGLYMVRVVLCQGFVGITSLCVKSR